MPNHNIRVEIDGFYQKSAPGVNTGNVKEIFEIEVYVDPSSSVLIADQIEQELKNKGYHFIEKTDKPIIKDYKWRIWTDEDKKKFED